MKFARRRYFYIFKSFFKLSELGLCQFPILGRASKPVLGMSDLDFAHDFYKAGRILVFFDGFQFGLELGNSGVSKSPSIKDSMAPSIISENC
ncbi:MAG: hypothetical protein EAZ42_04075 [Verrucomicrobia bacterium]|nr:MAG: hypothetical protein EAZ42_04075 [Verrucomicrobiota bacterium]